MTAISTAGAVRVMLLSADDAAVLLGLPVSERPVLVEPCRCPVCLALLNLARSAEENERGRPAGGEPGRTLRVVERRRGRKAA